MRVVCPYCRTAEGKSHKALIGRREELEPNVLYDLYCSCTNLEFCGASFVTQLSFSHTIKQPKMSQLEAAKLLLMGMTDDERATLLQNPAT